MSTSPLPPHNLDAEAAVIGALLINPDAFADVGGWLKGTHFYSSANGAIYDACIASGSELGRIDVVTVKERLRSAGKLEAVGGAHYVATLVDGTPESRNVVEHALIIMEKAKHRALLARHHVALAEGYSAGDVNEWSAATLADLGKLDADGAAEVGTSASEAVREMMHAWRNPDTSPTLGTGRRVLDRTIGRLARGNLIVVASHSGIGKSALVGNIIEHVLLEELVDGLPCGVLDFSLEMKAAEVTMRLACSRARVDSTKITDGRYGEPLTEDEGRAFIHAANEVGRPNLRIVDDADITIAQIRSHARRVAAEFRRAGTPLRLIVVDYAQIVNAGDTKRHGNREAEVSHVGREAKKMAAELNVPVILLAQLNADSKKEKRKPRVDDMRESKGLLNDANIALLIYNPDAIARAEAYADGNGARLDPRVPDEVDFIIGKRRSGPPCTVRAHYFPCYTLFADPS